MVEETKPDEGTNNETAAEQGQRILSKVLFVLEVKEGFEAGEIAALNHQCTTSIRSHPELSTSPPVEDIGYKEQVIPAN